MLTKKEMEMQARRLANELNEGRYDDESDFWKGVVVGKLLAYDSATGKKNVFNAHVHIAIACATRKWGV